MLLVILLRMFAAAQEDFSYRSLTQGWPAQWITGPGFPPHDYGVYCFRKSFDLATVPAVFPVRVSADNRYKLYVNSKLVSMGPARSDLLHWNYETVDLAPFLRPGVNVVAAQVWNEGDHTPVANVSDQTAFLLMGLCPEAEVLHTGDNWKCRQDSAYAPIPVYLNAYYVAGPGEYVDMNRTLAGWNAPDFDDSAWADTRPLLPAYEKYRVGFGQPNAWMLLPSPLPQMELTDHRFHSVRRAEGLDVPAGFPAETLTLTIPPHTVARLVLDQSHLTNAYLTLQFGGGKDATLTLEYAEALFEGHPGKGHRDDIEGKVFLGRKDSLLSNGKDRQAFTSLAFRTYRYVQLTVRTGSEALLLHDIYGTFTGYPFERLARLETDDPVLEKILDIGWRTARLCAFETYMDCPYYEQLQYIGDGRIQALVSLYNSGDDRLVKNFLNQVDRSRETEGITMSRAPTAIPQYIPPFSLWFVGAVHDYMMYGRDTAFVREKITGIRAVLAYFARFQQADGRVRHLPWWNFTDWVEGDPDWLIGIRRPGTDGCSALVDLPLLLAYQAAADIETHFGSPEYAAAYSREAERLKTAVRTAYWNEASGLFADDAGQRLYSQHTNALALLAGLPPVADRPAVAQKLLTDKSLAPASIYFKYYLHLALARTGLGDGYLGWLDKWRENIDMGMTTWAEDSNIHTTRSDCHAWGSSPNIELFRTVLGIDSAAPGFAHVRISPQLGGLTAIGGEMPHPNGTIRVRYEMESGQLRADILLPPDTVGTFHWKGRQWDLQPGPNRLRI
ncbi:MAG: hypothetical protein RLY31_2131 [Bacteroidota bacterium]|jgi:hypothetical protein